MPTRSGRGQAIPAGLDESGFGFVIVDALATKWGVSNTATGKAVWAELAV